MLRKMAATTVVGLLVFTAGCTASDPEESASATANSGAASASDQPALDFSDLQPEDFSGPAVKVFGAKAVAAGVQEALSFYYNVGLDRTMMDIDNINEQRIHEMVSPYMTESMAAQVSESAQYMKEVEALFLAGQTDRIKNLTLPTGFKDITDAREVYWFIEALSTWGVFAAPSAFRPLDDEYDRVVSEFRWDDIVTKVEKSDQFGDVLVVQIKPITTLLGQTDHALKPVEGPNGTELRPSSTTKRDPAAPVALEYTMKPTLEFVMIPGPGQAKGASPNDPQWLITDEYGFVSNAEAKKTNKTFAPTP